MMFRDTITREVIGYGMASACAFAVDVVLLWLLAKHAGMHYLVAATISFLAGGLVAYLLSIRFVFSQHRLETRAVEGTAFIALGLVGLAINIVVMRMAVGTAGAPLLVAKAASASLTFGVNFLLRKSLLFTRGRDVPASPPGS